MRTLRTLVRLTVYLLVQLLGWCALTIGLAGTWLLPRTRHGWLLAIACSSVWAIVDVYIQLWPGLAGAVLAIAVNWRCWHQHVGGSATPCQQPAHDSAPAADNPPADAAHTAPRRSAPTPTRHEATAPAAATAHTGDTPSGQHSYKPTHSAACAAASPPSQTTTH